MRSVIVFRNKFVSASKELATSILLASLSLLGIIQICDLLDVAYYPVRRRAVTINNFNIELSLAIPVLVLIIYWIDWMILNKRYKTALLPLSSLLVYPFSSAEVALILAIIIATISGLWHTRDLKGYVSGLFISLNVIETSALIHWGLILPLGIKSTLTEIAQIEMGLFYIAANLAPFLAIVLLFMWIPNLIINLGWNKIGFNNETRDNKDINKTDLLFLMFSILIGVSSSIYPYTSAINPQKNQIGTDIQPYVSSAEAIIENPSNIFSRSGGSRPVLHLVLYCFQQLTTLSAYDAVTYLPVILNPLLSLSIFMFSREIFDDKHVSRWAALLTACGIQVAVSMYAYFLANMLALSLVFISLTFIFRSLKTGRTLDLLLSCCIGFLLVFTHPWTFDQYLAALVILAAVMLYYSLNERRFEKIKFMTVFLACLGSSEMIKRYIFKGVSGLDVTSTVTEGMIELSELWESSQLIFRYTYGGLLSNVVLICLGIIGVYYLKRKNLSELFLLFFLMPSGLIYLLANRTIKNRLFFNIPLGLLAANGLNSLMHRFKTKHLDVALASFVSLSTLVYLFRSLANLI